MEKKRLTIDMPLEVHTRLKMLAAEHNLSMKDIIETFLDTAYLTSEFLVSLTKVKKQIKDLNEN